MQPRMLPDDGWDDVATEISEILRQFSPVTGPYSGPSSGLLGPCTTTMSFVFCFLAATSAHMTRVSKDGVVAIRADQRLSLALRQRQSQSEPPERGGDPPLHRNQRTEPVQSNTMQPGPLIVHLPLQKI